MSRPLSKLSQSSSSSSLAGASGTGADSNRPLKSPSSTITSFFSNIGQSLANHTRDPSHSSNPSLNSRLSTPPPSPNSPGVFTLPTATVNSESAVSHSYGRYAIKYIGSTALRRRHTLPMLNWIVTDLLYQSKCDGDELHVKIRNCVREEQCTAAFDRLRTQLTKDAHHHGLSVHFEMCQLSTSSSAKTPSSATEVAFQVSNAADGQVLLSHQCRRIFLFGKFTRESSLFYYLHKNQDDAQAVPTLYVFQAKDENQLSEICVKYNDLRPKLNIHNDKHLFVNSLNAKTGITSNCYEVLHIGSVMVSQKRADPSLVDRAAKEFGKKLPEKVEEEENEGEKEEDLPERAAVAKSSPIATSTNNNSSRGGRQFRANRFLVQVIDENEPLSSSAATEPETDRPCSPDGAFLAGSPTTLISNTQSLDCETRASLLQEFKRHQGLPHQISDVGMKKTDIRNVQFGKSALEEERDQKKLQEEKEMMAKASGGLKRSSSGETTMKKDAMSILSQMESFNRKRSRPTANKTMLFIIGQLDVCMISTENHMTVFSKTFSNISHCSQGITNTDHFGIIVREPFGPNSYSETYVAHIFKCSSAQIVNELLGSLRQSFNNAYRANKMRQNGTVFVDKNDLIVTNEAAKPDHPYCDNCPMNWFHQLCLDIDGLDNATIFALLMFRIEQHSSAEKREEFHSILKRINFTDPRRRVDILMILLKARAERMQKRHEISGCRLNSMTIYDQCDEESDSRSTSSLTRLEGLKMMAKSSLTNTFESLFKINKNFASSESLHGKFQSDIIAQPPTPTSSNTVHSFSALDQRRNTLADPEAAAINLNQEAAKKEALRQQMEKSMSLGKSEQKSLLNIFMKVSGSQTKLNSLEELSQNLNQLENEQVDLPSGGNLTNRLAKMERQSSVNTQLRHKLFKRIKRSIRECDLNGTELSSLQSTTPKGASSVRTHRRRNSRDLWKFAIHQQILLNKMNKQHFESEGTHLATCDSADRIEYQAIPRLESPKHLEKLSATWERLIKSYNAREPSTNFEEEIYRAICDGVPKSRKRDAWRFVAQFRRKNRAFVGTVGAAKEKLHEPSKVYRGLLKELTVQQHAIFVDLGRTFPGVSFFAETMGFGQLSLFNLLKAYSLYDKEVEYCQGLSFVAGILLLHMNEDEAFDLMCYVLYDCGLREQYKPDMEALQMQMYQFIRLLYDHNRLLHDHLELHEVPPTLYAAPCFLTLFASQFSIAFVSRVFDFLIFFGIEAIFRIFFALIERIADRILSCDDFESTMEVLRTELVVTSQEEMEQIFATILRFDFAKQLEQYRVEYKILQEEFAHLSLINSKNYTSQPNVNRDEARQPSVDRFLAVDLNGSNENIDSRRRHASDQQSLRTEMNIELGKLKQDKEMLEKENSSLREMLIQLERQVSTLQASNRQFESDNESLHETVHQLENRMRRFTLDGARDSSADSSEHSLAATGSTHGSQGLPEKRQLKKSSESDDEKCFVYVDAEEFPDPL